MTKGKPQFLMVAHTDPGMVRHINEDAVFTDAEAGLAILADGMGGYSAGEKASALTIETVAKALLDCLPRLRAQPLSEATEALHEDIDFAVRRANSVIRSEARRDPDCEGMGSTLVVAALLDGQITVGHVGDSRLYRYRAGEVSQLTRDHSWLQEQLQLGAISAEQARESRFKNLVTRGLGIEEDVEVEIHDHPLQPDDVYLLCSDGLSDMVDEATMLSVLRDCGQDLDQAATRLIKLANDNGGRDNISIILIGGDPPPTGWLRGLTAKLGL